MAASVASTANGCSYGRSNRWFMGSVLLVWLATSAASFGIMHAQIGALRIEVQANVAVLDAKVVTESLRVQESREGLARLEERLMAITDRLKTIDDTLRRIESATGAKRSD